MSMEQWKIDAFAAAIRQSAEPGFELSGRAPYTPVTVSAKTKPVVERIKDDAEFNPFSALWITENENQQAEDIRDMYHREVTVPMTNALCEKVIEELEDDGFNPYGSGPEPIGRRE